MVLKSHTVLCQEQNIFAGLIMSDCHALTCLLLIDANHYHVVCGCSSPKYNGDGICLPHTALLELGPLSSILG